MFTRARRNPSDEDGFIIIEVLVSALILAIVAGAVLTLITATTRGAAVQRDRAVANDIAQADQARMRTLKLTEISGVEKKERTESRNGTVYTVKSERQFINYEANAATCASASSKPDYVELTTTVSSNTMIRPVVLQSAVSPSSGSLDENNGTITAKAVNAQGSPVAGISVTATSSAAGTRTARTGPEGCANFVSVPEGEYEMAYNGNGLINSKGEEKSSEKVKLAAGAFLSLPTISWDHPATLEPRFYYLNPSTAKLEPALVDSMYIANATNGVTIAVGTPGGTRYSALSKAVFPFKAPGEYTVFAGYCSTNNPGTAGGNAVGLYTGLLAPSAKPTGIAIRVPALEVTVKNAAGAIVSGAKVIVTDANSSCKYNGSSIKRTYLSNTGGHLASSATGLTEPGLPYGTYNVCASLKVGTKFQSVTVKEVKVQNFAASTPLALNLVEGGSECT